MANDLMLPDNVTPEQVELIRRTIAADATPDELQLYLYDCRRRGTHPLDRLIHFTKRSGKYTPITSIDFMRAKAAEGGDYAGNDDPVFIVATDPKVKYPVQASVTVWRLIQGTRTPFTASARWAEYYPGDSQAGFMWRRMPFLMLGKVSEALALRKAFPLELSGLYASEELERPDQETLGEVADRTRIEPPRKSERNTTQDAPVSSSSSPDDSGIEAAPAEPEIVADPEAPTAPKTEAGGNGRLSQATFAEISKLVPLFNQKLGKKDAASRLIQEEFSVTNVMKLTEAQGQKLVAKLRLGVDT